MSLQPWAPNPITLAHDQLWAHIDALAELDHVKKNNRIKYNAERTQAFAKKNVQVADLPELMILPEGLDGLLVASSAHSEINWRAAIITSTGEKSHSVYLAQVQWYLWKVLYQLNAFRGAISYRSKPFLVNVLVIDSVSGLTDPQYNRGIEGWSSILRVQFQLRIPRTFLCTDIGDELVTDPNLESGWAGGWDDTGSGTLVAFDTEVVQTSSVTMTDATLHRVDVYVREVNGGSVKVEIGAEEWTLDTVGYHSKDLTANALNTITLTGTNITLAYVSVKEVVEVSSSP